MDSQNRLVAVDGFLLLFFVVFSGACAFADDNCLNDSYCYYDKATTALVEDDYHTALKLLQKAQQVDPSLGLEDQIKNLKDLIAITQSSPSKKALPPQQPINADELSPSKIRRNHTIFHACKYFVMVNDYLVL